MLRTVSLTASLFALLASLSACSWANNLGERMPTYGGSKPCEGYFCIGGSDAPRASNPTGRYSVNPAGAAPSYGSAPSYGQAPTTGAVPQMPSPPPYGTRPQLPPGVDVQPPAAYGQPSPYGHPPSYPQR